MEQLAVPAAVQVAAHASALASVPEKCVWPGTSLQVTSVHSQPERPTHALPGPMFHESAAATEPTATAAAEAAAAPKSSFTMTTAGWCSTKGGGAGRGSTKQQQQRAAKLTFRARARAHGRETAGAVVCFHHLTATSATLLEYRYALEYQVNFIVIRCTYRYNVYIY
jgi:hypothetical protein